VDSQGRTIWNVEAHRDDGKHFIVRADEKLTALLNSNRRFAGYRDDHPVNAREQAATNILVP
jgi:hypothetical protein